MAKVSFNEEVVLQWPETSASWDADGYNSGGNLLAILEVTIALHVQVTSVQKFQVGVKDCGYTHQDI